jgi:hypothetical protein
MLEHLEQGDVAETVKEFFEKSRHVQPTKKSTLSLQDVSVHNAAIRPQVAETVKVRYLVGNWKYFTPQWSSRCL